MSKKELKKANRIGHLPLRSGKVIVPSHKNNKKIRTKIKQFLKKVGEWLGY